MSWARGAVWSVVASVGLAGGAVRAEAQPGAPRDGRAMDAYRVEARDAALRGDCKMVGTIAQLVADVDAAYYRDVFLRDTVVVSCNGGVGGVQLPPSAIAPPANAPTAPSAGSFVSAEGPGAGKAQHSDAARGVGGLFLGLGLGAVGGFLGAYAGALVGTAAHGEECSSWCDEVVIPAVIGFQIGANVGLAVGIGAAGNHAGSQGSFGTSLMLGLAGSGISWLFALNDETIDNGMFGVAFFALPVLGTMTGYWMTHEHDDVTVVPTGNGLAITGRF
jgi:hypothetical protein